MAMPEPWARCQVCLPPWIAACVQSDIMLATRSVPGLATARCLYGQQATETGHPFGKHINWPPESPSAVYGYFG